MQKETTGSAGAWNSFAKVKKNTPSARGQGWLDNIKIRFILDDRNAVNGSDGGHVFNYGLGTLWCLAYQATAQTVDGEGSQIDPENIVSIRASGSHGNVRLPAMRAIKQDGFDEAEADGELYLWMKNTDITDDDTLVWRIHIETEGRYVESEGL
tara:strand:+ start:74 stop:535 length:462 start_codon:yes stop_codon:yes gene_type:complete